MATYVLSDIHGLYDKFMNMLSEIRFTDSDVLYIIGDVIDRGPDGIKLYQFLMQHENIHVLKGNHEAFFLDAFSEKMKSDIGKDDIEGFLSRNRIWTGFNGGASTVKEFFKLNANEQREIYDYIRHEKEYELINVNDRQYLLIHAGLNLTENMSLQEMLERDIKREEHLWIREDFLCSPKRLKDITIIFGHTPTPLLPVRYLDSQSMGTANLQRCKYALIYHGDGKIDIDCGCAGNLNLGCLRLEDFEEFYA